MPKQKKRNLLSEIDSQQSRKKRRTVWIVVVLILVILLAACTTIFFIYKPYGLEAYRQALKGRDAFLEAQDEITQQEFERASTSLTNATNAFEHSRDALRKMTILRFVPLVNTQISAVEKLLLAGVEAGKGMQDVVTLAESIIEPFKHDDTFTFSSLSQGDKRVILEKIYKSKPDLLAVKARVDKAAEYINDIPDKGLLGKIKETTGPIKEKIPSLQTTFDQAVTASQIVPLVVGYPNQKTYLFLLQNNTEMRPTGGFIGTYGIVKLKDGEIVSFNTDNVYNLDSQAEDYLFVDPPSQLTRYNNVHRWFLRDANWSPDFPTSAKKALEFYRLERGPEKKIDGVIAITPSLIQSLIAITGDIRVNGILFTKDNFVDTLQYQVEQGFLRQGIEQKERKEIIGDLAGILIERILNLPKKDWPAFFGAIENDLSERHILLYTNDADLEDLVVQAGWGGEIKQTAGDYLMVIDANLASLKSDPAVERSIRYTLITRQGKGEAEVRITYHHTGTITWKTTRYRTYTRVYVPQGAKLISHEGAMVDCKKSDEGMVETSEEEGRTVFGTFVCIEPDEQRDLVLRYSLPESIVASEQPYKLFVQKQAGTPGHGLNITLEFDTPWSWITPFDKVVEKGQNKVVFQTDLQTDRQFTIEF